MTQETTYTNKLDLDKDMANSDNGKLAQMIAEDTPASIDTKNISPDTDKEYWSNKIEYSLTVLGYCVGLGNLYRFPYLCLRNGGAAFLVPYFFFLFLVGIPLFVMEMYLGQYSGLSPVSVWNISPFFKGNGISVSVFSAILTTMYAYLVGLCLVYTYQSFRKQVPWNTCSGDWNTASCVDSTGKSNLFNIEEALDIDNNYTQQLVFNNSIVNMTSTVTMGSTPKVDFVANNNNGTVVFTSAAQEFYENKILHLSSGIEEMGQIQWHSIIACAVTWFIACVAVSRGVKTIGKVVYITALLPYVMLTALLIRSATLPGAWDGIKFYIIPDLSRLLDFNVWFEALMQIFFSLGPGWGGIIAMSAHSEYHSNFVRHGIFLALGCCLTSFFGGFVTFAILGFLAQETGSTVQQVARSGPGLSFVTYPEALSHMPLAPAWSIVFFLMLFNVALESIFVEAEMILTIIMERFSALKKHRLVLCICWCVCGFLFNLPFSTGAGVYLFQLVDWYLGSFSAMLICLCECVAVTICYGSAKVREDIKSMTGGMPSRWWTVNWMIITPAILVFMLIYSAAAMTEPYYGSYTYPRLAIALSWTLTVLTLAPIPTLMIVEIVKQSGPLRQRLKNVLRPSSLWRPQAAEYQAVAVSATKC